MKIKSTSNTIYRLKKRYQESIAITILVFVIIGVFSFIPVNLTFLDPLEKALTDFDSYDIVFSKLRQPLQPDTNIVLINAGNLSREGIAREIMNINKFKPAVIGLDIIFEGNKNPVSDSLLSYALSSCRNLVMISELKGYNEARDYYDSLRLSAESFNKYAANGYANFVSSSEDGFRTIRSFRPKALYKNHSVYSFPVKILEKYNKKSFNKFLERGNSIETINYRGNINRFYCIDAEDMLDGAKDFSFIKNKIVLLGYLGPDLNSKTFEDIFFTPLNEKYAGRTFPDMYGLLIHANILSMLINRNFIEIMPAYLSMGISFFLCLIYTGIFLKIKQKYIDWFGSTTKIILFIQALLILIIGLNVFALFSYKINLTLLLVASFLIPAAIDIYHNYFEKLYLYSKKLTKKENNA